MFACQAVGPGSRISVSHCHHCYFSFKVKIYHTIRLKLLHVYLPVSLRGKTSCRFSDFNLETSFDQSIVIIFFIVIYHSKKIFSILLKV